MLKNCTLQHQPEKYYVQTCFTASEVTNVARIDVPQLLNMPWGVSIIITNYNGNLSCPGAMENQVFENITKYKRELLHCWSH
jgi:hypothetical protein